MKKRNITLDIARSIAMLIVVFGWHLLQYLTIDEKSYECRHYIGPYVAISLSLFTFLSGYFLKFYRIDSIANFGPFYKKRFLRLYPLFFASALILYVGGMNKGFMLFLNTITGLSVFSFPHPYTLWYVCMLLVFYLITPVILYRNHFIYKCTILIAFGLLFIYFPGIDDRVKLYYPFYALGLLSNFDIDKLCSKIYIEFVILAFFILYNLSLFKVINIGYLNNHYVLSFIGIAFFIVLAKFLSKFRLMLFSLSSVAYASMTIYLFHRMIFKVLFYFTPNSLFVQAFYSLFVVLPITVFICYFIQLKYDQIIARYLK